MTERSLTGDLDRAHHHLRSLPGAGALVSKQQLAAHLGRSTRWVELRVREGMPSEPPTKRFPHRRFRVADVEAWLSDSRLQQPADRLSRLEREVATLAATVEELKARAG
jgi:hypothetical protein